MLGPLVNAAAVIVGALAGKFIFRNVPPRVEEIIIKAIAIALIYIGVTGAMGNERIMLLILSLIIGSVIGELIGIDKGMNRIGTWAESKLGFGEGNFSKGFVTASILFCTGSMAIVGSLESGLAGNHEMLFAKSVLDGVMSIVFASQMGWGVLFSFIPVLLYEGAITLGASFVKGFLTAQIISEMSAVGSLLIAIIGFNFMGVKEIKVANMIPAIFIPLAYIALENLFL
jgi:uncharacterized membrane protein YqgA involved in biofilm formation